MNAEQPSPARFQWDAATIRAFRTFVHRSQSAFARELGVRQQTVSEWETGMYRPRGASATLLTIVAREAGFQAGEPAGGSVEQPSIPEYQVPARRHVSAASGSSFPPPAPGTGAAVDSSTFFTASGDASETGRPQNSASRPPFQAPGRPPIGIRQGEVPI